MRRRIDKKEKKEKKEKREREKEREKTSAARARRILTVIFFRNCSNPLLLISSSNFACCSPFASSVISPGTIGTFPLYSLYKR